MNIEKIAKGDTFVTCMKSYLRFDYKTEKLYFFTLINKKGVEKKEKKDRHGAITVRVKRSYSEEVVLSFKKVNIQCQK